MKGPEGGSIGVASRGAAAAPSFSSASRGESRFSAFKPSRNASVREGPVRLSGKDLFKNTVPFVVSREPKISRPSRPQNEIRIPKKVDPFDRHFGNRFEKFNPQKHQVPQRIEAPKVRITSNGIRFEKPVAPKIIVKELPKQKTEIKKFEKQPVRTRLVVTAPEVSIKRIPKIEEFQKKVKKQVNIVEVPDVKKLASIPLPVIDPLRINVPVQERKKMLKEHTKTLASVSEKEKVVKKTLQRTHNESRVQIKNKEMVVYQILAQEKAKEKKVPRFIRDENVVAAWIASGIAAGEKIADSKNLNPVLTGADIAQIFPVNNNISSGLAEKLKIKDGSIGPRLSYVAKTGRIESFDQLKKLLANSVKEIPPVDVAEKQQNVKEKDVALVVRGVIPQGQLR